MFFAVCETAVISDVMQLATARIISEMESLDNMLIINSVLFKDIGDVGESNSGAICKELHIFYQENLSH